MTSTIVPTTTTTTTASTGEAAREARPVADLREGDWIAAGNLFDEAGDTIAVPVEVLAAHPKNDPLFGPSYLAVFRLPNGDLITDTYTAGAEDLPLATEAELQEAKLDGRRQVAASQLRQLAALIVERRFPMPKHSLQIFNHSVKSMEELAAIADAVGSTVEHSYNDRYEVVWPPNHQSYQDGVHIEWSAVKESEPVEVADPDHGRTTAVADAKPDTLVVPVGRAAKNPRR